MQQPNKNTQSHVVAPSMVLGSALFVPLLLLEAAIPDLLDVHSILPQAVEQPVDLMLLLLLLLDGLHQLRYLLLVAALHLLYYQLGSGSKVLFGGCFVLVLFLG